MTIRILSVSIYTELDIVAARQRAREIAELCGFGLQEQARIGTAISELARNVYNYAREGKIEFSIEGATSPQILAIRIQDRGPGIRNLDKVLSANYQSSTGMGAGIIGARRLMDRFEIVSNNNGTDIKLQKIFPKDALIITPKLAGKLFTTLTTLAPNIILSEVQQQNKELLSALAELKARQEELLQLTRELEDTNRGVIALYAELDEKADHLRRADELKSRFLSNMSHEFRTPLSSIRALANLLIDRMDGDLSVEQERQVSFILQCAEGLSELVNDLLDLAKIEAGKVDVKPIHFDISDMFSALRGMLRPLLVSRNLTLNFEEPAHGLDMFNDEAKVSQILRNFISNALKFTETGEIKITATRLLDEEAIAFSVADTGIGIAEEDLSLIFEEFCQIENHLQRGIKGTGLGLPLCRKLATLLLGRIEVKSQVGVGSVFSVIIPTYYAASWIDQPGMKPAIPPPDERKPLLVVEDNRYDRLVYEIFFADSEFRIVLAQSLREADNLWEEINPVAVILDIFLKGEDSWRWLAEQKNNHRRKTVPIIVASEVDDKRKGLALGADAYYVKPLLKHELLKTLNLILQTVDSNVNGLKA